MAWPLFLVQTKAATPFHPPPPWELQFRGDRFLLGSASRHLSPGRVCRMSCNICVTATSANCNVTLRHRANFRLPRRDIRQAWRRAWGRNGGQGVHGHQVSKIRYPRDFSDSMRKWPLRKAGQTDKTSALRRCSRSATNKLFEKGLETTRLRLPSDTREQLFQEMRSQLRRVLLSGGQHERTTSNQQFQSSSRPARRGWGFARGSW